MSADISADLRRLVSQRANGCCEYCLMPELLAAHLHEPDHVIALQHGGQAKPENLALACMRCNRNKGPNPGSFDPKTGALVRFFNPRTQRWDDHFRMEGAEIQPLTPEGRVTVMILRLNDNDRIAERLLWLPHFRNRL